MDRLRHARVISFENSQLTQHNQSGIALIPRMVNGHHHLMSPVTAQVSRAERERNGQPCCAGIGSRAAYNGGSLDW